MRVEVLNREGVLRYILRPESAVEQRFLTDVVDLCLPRKLSLRPEGSERSEREVRGIPPKGVLAAGFEVVGPDGEAFRSSLRTVRPVDPNRPHAESIEERSDLAEERADE